MDEIQKQLNDLKNDFEDFKRKEERDIREHEHDGLQATSVNTKNLFGKIVVDKILDKVSGIYLPDKHYILSSFESIDGWTVSAGVTMGLFNANLSTGAVSGTERTMRVDGVLVVADFVKNSEFLIICGFAHTTNVTAYLTIGGNDVAGGEIYYGFKMVNGVLSAVTSDGSTEKVTIISGITLSSANVFKATLIPGKEVRFSINNIVYAVHTDNLPVTTADTLIFVSIKNTEALDKIMRVASVGFMQDF